EDQIYVLDQILDYIDNEDIDAVVIAGDLYDKKQPSQEAMNVVDHYLKEINLVRKKPLLLISGNHDSKPDVDARSEWFKANECHVNTTLEDSVMPITIQETDVYILQYLETPEVLTYYN